MTIALSGEQVAARLNAQFPGSIISSSPGSLEVKPENLLAVAGFLKSSPEFEFDYLACLTAVDYQDYFEVIYQLASIKHNHSLVLRSRCYDRDNASLPSVVSVWRGADLQEREISDLFGITFEGHPNPKPLLLWEGFRGYPLRKDYVAWS